MKSEQKWDIAEVEAIFWICSEAVYSLTTGMKKIYGFAFSRNFVFFQKDKPFKWCLLKNEMTEVGNKFFNKFKNKKFRKKLINDYQRLKPKVDKKLTEYCLKDTAKMSVNELFKWLKIFTFYYKQNFNYGFFTEAFDYVFSDKFNQALAKYNLSNEEFSDLSLIPQPTYLSIENQKLIRLAIRKKAGQDIKKNLIKHLKEYEWLATGHAGKKLIKLDYFQQKINSLITGHKNLKRELNNLKQSRSRALKRKKEIFKKYHFNQEVLTIVDIIDEIGPLHDLRKELFVKTIYYADDVREEIAKRFGYRLADLQFFKLKELLPLLEGKKLDRLEIKRREQFIALDVDAKKSGLG
ncbi:MAG: hypothetical protein A3J62_03410 [Candidatus Buchananbacteria bacterium RIFCSPHIGHO2_02_FULL_38_8]|uniref:Uncharacterized protein n=2 Tax=Candidatus Buchananiibacteriota TaxID=1817903 RepID=A0A1G1XT37_9BACT|nr:MAG: hypothetical protein A2731_03495 [Candidatus Buchananbacteria bacterium RIFCSPHIGHO2_01_FULL_39_8]OGY47044.1 MAG: hypothetical protein A3J62_03410 [Candidatus Buchananbacteria bacterium RIFCSPHIGHO2_02_FULL_38_8]